MERLDIARESTPSVGMLTEQRAHPDAIITYIQPNLVSQFAARFSKHARGGQAPARKPNPPVHVSYTVQGVVNEVTETGPETGDLSIIATSFGKVHGEHEKEHETKKKKSKDKDALLKTGAKVTFTAKILGAVDEKGVSVIKLEADAIH